MVLCSHRGVLAGTEYRLSAPLFPWRVPFHGLYCAPVAQWAHVEAGDASVDVGGVGGTMGWEWTWRLGLTLRLGAGGMYGAALVRGPSPTASLVGARPLADAAVWAELF